MIMPRHPGRRPTGTAEPFSGAEIRVPREQAHLSRAAFAGYLNLTTGYISQLERGAKPPKGPALALLNVIRGHGGNVIPLDRPHALAESTVTK